MENKEKTYIINGQEVNEYGEEIKPKKTKKALSILVALGLTGILATGAYMSMEAVSRNIPTLDSEIIATVTNPEEKQDQYEILLSDGTRILATKDTIVESISGQDNICVNGVYYSDTAENLMHIEASYTSKYESEATQNTKYVAPAGYILIGNKCYKQEYVIDAEKHQNTQGNTVYSVPAGYVLIGNKGVKQEAYEEAIEATKTTTYTAPSGYILEGDKAVKYVTRKIHYILTLDEYNNNLQEILANNGEIKNYSGNLVETKPLSELYELLGVEQPKTNKLTK